MSGENFPLAFTHDVPWRGCKPAAEGIIPASRHALLGSHSGFYSLYPYFCLQKLEDLATLTSILLGDNSQWELSRWPPSKGSCVCYNCFHFHFLIPRPPPLYSFLPHPPGPFKKEACNSHSTEAVPPAHVHLFKFKSSLMVHGKCHPLFPSPTIQWELTVFWLLTTFLAYFL